MELEQERLVDEILGWNRSFDYCPWPRRTVRTGRPRRIAPPKSKLTTIWNAEDSDRLSRFMEGGAESFHGRLGVPHGSKLLDVACGSGQLALMAARYGAEVTGVEMAANLIGEARERARVEGLKAHFQRADAQALPFARASFDVVTSLVGAMFAPHPELVARELLRVCRPGGIIAMANWTAQGFVGQMFKTISKYIAPSGLPDPVLWGDEYAVRERIGAGVSKLTLTRRSIALSFPFPPSEVVRFFRRYGPANHAFASLNRTGRMRLHADMTELWSTHNLAKGAFTRVDAEWLEVHAVRA